MCEPGDLNPRGILLFLLVVLRTTLTCTHNTRTTLAFCLDWNLDTDDFTNMGLFSDEVSRRVPTALKKNYLDNGIGIAGVEGMFQL